MRVANLENMQQERWPAKQELRIPIDVLKALMKGVRLFAPKVALLTWQSLGSVVLLPDDIGVFAGAI